MWFDGCLPFQVCLTTPVDEELLSRQVHNGGVGSDEADGNEDPYVSTGYMDPNSFCSKIKAKVTLG